MYRAQNRKTPTIGVLVDWVSSPYQGELLEGLRGAASSAAVNLLCFVGGSLPADPAIAVARHRVYELCGRHNVDGLLLLSSTLTHQVGQAGLSEYCQRYQSLPLCSIGVELPGHTSLLVDNEVGMREGIVHLMREHGVRRVAFVRGPLANPEAESRVSAYRSALTQNAIAFEPKLVLGGDFTLSSGRQAVQDLAAQYGSRLDGVEAIVASNDAMAAGVLAGLEERGIAVPDQIKVLGFDDVEDARLTRPPLTTLKQPLDKQGREALRSILDALQFAGKPGVVRLPTELVLRRSCGCQGPVPETTHSRPPEQQLSFEAALMVRRQRILDSMMRAARGSFGAAGKDWQNRLFNALVADARGAQPASFPVVLQDIAEKVSCRRVDLELCDELINVLREKVLPSLGPDLGVRERLEHSFHQARVAVRRTAQRDLMREHLLLARRGRALNQACSNLSSAFDLQELAATIHRDLPRLDIDCCIVALHQSEGGPRAARVLTGYDRRSGRRWGDSNAFEPRMLLPPELLHADDAGRSFLVLPLAHRQHLLGHALFELNSESVFAAGAVALSLSVAVWGARLSAAAGSG